jgi:hypothetical protein
MKEIPLYNAAKRGSKTLIHTGNTLVDDDDYERFSGYRWIRKRCPRAQTYYACRHTRIDGRRVGLFLHREIMGLGSKSQDRREVDHISHEGQDNRRENLRITDCTENRANFPRRKDNRYGPRGITEKPSGRWEVTIKWRGVKYYLGTHPTKTEASYVWNHAASILHGQYAVLNTVPIETHPSPEKCEQIKAEVEAWIEKKNSEICPQVA